MYKISTNLCFLKSLQNWGNIKCSILNVILIIQIRLHNQFHLKSCTFYRKYLQGKVVLNLFFRIFSGRFPTSHGNLSPYKSVLKYYYKNIILI